jgi:hypothetical protein
MVRSIVLGSLLTGCAYTAADPAASSLTRRLREPLPASGGCLRVGVRRAMDQEARPQLVYDLTNRCVEPVEVGLAWTEVIGRTHDGAEVALIPVDLGTADEHTVAPLAQRQLRVGYQSSSKQPIGQLCVDTASLTGERPARWSCFGNPEAVAVR